MGKTVNQTAIEDHTYRIFPNDLNSLGTVFGGLVMATIDRLCLVVAERHSGRACVTASVDAINFLAPAGGGDNLIFKVAINRSWRTSMEIGAKVYAESSTSTEMIHIVSAYYTFVALDEQKRPTQVDEVIAETPVQKRRFEEAELRRQSRIRNKQSITEYRKTFPIHG